MRVTSVELHPTGSSFVAVLSYRDPGRQNPYNVKSIVGLDADEIVPRYYGGSGSNAFYDLALEKREPGFQILLNPSHASGESYSGLRDNLYKMISSSRRGTVEVQFKDGNTVVAVLTGFVIKFEAALFDKEPGVLLVLKCLDPQLKAPDRVSVDVAALDPSLTVINDPMSTAPHGFTFVATFAQARSGFKIHNPADTTWSFEIIPSGGFLAGDALHFSSESKNKELYLVRGGVTTHLADKITPGSMWPILFPGDNTFAVDGVTVVGGVRSLSWNSITHYPTYWGV